MTKQINEKSPDKKVSIMNVSWITIFIFLLLQIIVSVCTFIILFLQSRPSMVNASYFEKLLANEFWTSIEWGFALPAIKIGFEFLTMPQIILVTYLIGFVVQIFVDKYWLKIPIHLDTYVCMVIMMIAMVIAKLELFG